MAFTSSIRLAKLDDVETTDNHFSNDTFFDGLGERDGSGGFVHFWSDNLISVGLLDEGHSY